MTAREGKQKREANHLGRGGLGTREKKKSSSGLKIHTYGNIYLSGLSIVFLLPFIVSLLSTLLI